MDQRIILPLCPEQLGNHPSSDVSGSDHREVSLGEPRSIKPAGKAQGNPLVGGQGRIGPQVGVVGKTDSRVLGQMLRYLFKDRFEFLLHRRIGSLGQILSQRIEDLRALLLDRCDGLEPALDLQLRFDRKGVGLKAAQDLFGLHILSSVLRDQRRIEHLLSQ